MFNKFQFAAAVLLFVGLAASAQATASNEPRVMLLAAPEAASLAAVQQLPEAVRHNPRAWLWLLADPDSAVSRAYLLDPGTRAEVPGNVSLLFPPLTARLLMIDDSISMWPSWDQAREGLQNLWALLPEGELAGVFACSEKLTQLRPLWPKAAEETIDEQVRELKNTGQFTVLYSCLLEAFDHLSAASLPGREIVLFSDGDAEDRALTQGEVIAAAEKKGIKVHTVACPGSPNRNRPARLTAPQLKILERLAKDTGGLMLEYKDQEGLAEFFRKPLNIPLQVMAVELTDLSPLGYGQDSLVLRVETETAQGGAGRIFEHHLKIEGPRTWDSLLVSLGRRTGHQDPRLLIAAPPLLLLLAMVWFCLRRRRRRLDLALARQKEQARLTDIQRQQDEQGAKLDEALKALNAAARREEDPKASVLSEGKPFGWLVESGGRVYNLVKYSTRIGRSRGSDVVLDDEYVSNEHAILDFKKGRFVWTDRAPSNPTRIDGRKVEGSLTIKPGAVIVCGRTTLTFNLDLAGE